MTEATENVNRQVDKTPQAEETKKTPRKSQRGNDPKSEEKPVKRAEPLFTLRQLASSSRFSEKRDILNALLKEDALYTVKQAENIIEEYMKGKVQ